MKNILDLLDEPDTTVAVVGATDNSSKIRKYYLSGFET